MGETSSRQGSQRTSPEKNTETEDRNETNKQSESTDGEKVSFSAAQTHLENVLSEVKGQVTDNTDDSKTVNGQTTPSLERKSSLEKRNTNTEKSGASSKLCDAHTNGANIFLQIDPTVKRKENAGSQNTSKIPVKQSGKCFAYNKHLISIPYTSHTIRQDIFDATYILRFLVLSLE